ncbi:MAG: ATP-binding cassette domain-containing protein [Oscillospiraceae bacterium]|nr:ATP-binding cassette domain-containing protein [Oscillospiraceae bacterium]
MSEHYLELKNVKKHFYVPSGTLHAVDGVSFTLEKGRTIGVVGESGCGKSTLGRVVSRLLDATGGEILFEGEDILHYKGRRLKDLRRKIQMIFQDPFSSLNPRKTIYNTIAEPMITQKLYSGKKAVEEKVFEIMKLVGLAERYINTYPHELDGGRRQRVGIARALALAPELIVCDEPVSALDVSIQAQILNLLKRLQQQFGYSYIFITHDLSVVKHFTQEVLVMYLGQMVEKASVNELFSNPKHPYTQALLSAIPLPDIDNVRERVILKGELTSPINPKDECRFADRCAYATNECREKCPSITELGEGHYIRCFHPL